MKIVIPLYDSFTALDVIGPYEVLGKLPGAKTVFAGRERRVYRSDTPTLGIEAEAAFSDIDRADLLLVGGTAHLAQVTANPPLIEFVKRMHATTTWSTSVCTGALALASAGLLQLALEYDPQPPFDAGSPEKAGPELVKLVSDLMAPAMNAPASP